MKNKRGQAFLISSVIIIMVLVAFVTISNFSRKTTFSTFPFIAEEIQIESEKVMDYVLISGDNSAINSFTRKVSNRADSEDITIYFIEGGNCYSHSKDARECSISTGNKIVATIDQTNYEFDLTQGKHFYFIMIQESKGEKYIFTNA